MDKKEIYSSLERKGLLNSFSRDETWLSAFQEYNKIHYQKMKMGCSGCYRKVLEWLKS